MFSEDQTARANFEVNDPEDITETVVVGRRPGSLTVTLTEQQYQDIRTLIMRDTFENHPGEGLGPLGDEGGPFHTNTAVRLGDARDAHEASTDDTEGPL